MRSPPSTTASLVPELSILKPIDPAIAKSEDDYEIYTLANAHVFYTSGRLAGRPASLLDAYADRPLRVEGRLEALERSQHKCLVKKPFRPVDVVLADVTRYSYGQTEEGEIVIWALGAAGWFEIRPGRGYREVYAGMVQAVGVLYFVADIYNEPRKRGGGPSAGLIWREVSFGFCCCFWGKAVGESRGGMLGTSRLTMDILVCGNRRVWVQGRRGGAADIYTA